MIKFIVSRAKEIVSCIVYSLHCFSASRKLAELIPTPYLENGDYDIVLSGRYFLVKEGISKNYKQLLGIKARRSFVKPLNNNANPQSPICGQVLMLTANSSRFFDFSKKLTFTHYSTIRNVNNIVLAQQNFIGIFENTIIKVEDCCIIEQLIEYKPRDEWNSIEVINNFYFLVENYIKYLEKEYPNRKLVNFLKYQKPLLEKTSLKDFDTLYKRLENDIAKEPFVDFVYCHCDFHFGNTLFSNNGIYLIDFEYCREEVFFYDIFNVMYVEFISKKNSTLLDLYLSEDKTMINYMMRSFKAMHCDYDIKKKVIYFEIFLMARLIFSCFKRPLKTNKESELRCRIKTNVSLIGKVLNYIQYFNCQGKTLECIKSERERFLL